jgi:hypothetical protein
VRVGQFLQTIAADLNDPDFRAWPESQLLAHMEEGLLLAAQVKPDWLSEERVLTFGPGHANEYKDVRPCLCLGAEMVLGQSDCRGAVFQKMKPRAAVMEGVWPGNWSGARKKPVRLREFAVALDRKGIKVFPGIPPGESAHVAVRCPVLPDLQDPKTELPSDVVPALTQWVLFRAKSADGGQNPAMLKMAGSHRDACFALMGVSVPKKNLSDLLTAE